MELHSIPFTQCCIKKFSIIYLRLHSNTLSCKIKVNLITNASKIFNLQETAMPNFQDKPNAGATCQNINPYVKSFKLHTRKIKSAIV